MARKRINWTKVLTHPDDYRQNQAESERRQHARRYGESADETTGRVCELVGAGSFELGYDKNRSDPARQGITWDAKAKRWIVAPMHTGEVTLSKQARIVAHNAPEAVRALRGTLAVNGGWKTVGRR